MIANGMISVLSYFMSFLPVLSLPSGVGQAIGWLTAVCGYINIFIPLASIAPIIGMIILVRNWFIVHSIIRFVMRFIPTLSGG